MILKIAIADVNGDYAERISDVLGVNPEVKVSMYTDNSIQKSLMLVLSYQHQTLNNLF